LSLRPLSFEAARANFKPIKRGTIKRGTKRLTASTKLKAAGKKGQEWIDVRRQLKKRFGWAGITVCEFRFQGCWFSEGLGFAHCKKRRKLVDLEIWHCALACNRCHDLLDLHMSHEEMHLEVHKIIEKRGLLAPPAVLQQIQEQENRS
jgi:hypothetical protein